MTCAITRILRRLTRTMPEEQKYSSRLALLITDVMSTFALHSLTSSSNKEPMNLATISIIWPYHNDLFATIMTYSQCDKYNYCCGHPGSKVCCLLNKASLY